jgi:NAD-dependent SIR2 family protein deacetylase
MNTVRKGLREGELERDTYERLRCAECETVLDTKNDPEEIGTIRTCPDCGRQWQELS